MRSYAFWPFESHFEEDMANARIGAGKALRYMRRSDPSTHLKVVRYGSRKHRDGLSGCQDAAKSLYVLGHGARGDQSISNMYDATNLEAEILHAIIVVGRLIEYGLQKTSKCKVKLFTCYSGEDGLNGEACFARAIHMTLRYLQYNDVEVYGYRGAVIPPGANDGQHTAFLGTHPLYGYGLWNKASAVRIRIV